MAQVCQTTGFPMKFYKDQSKNDFYYYDIISFNNLDAIYYDTRVIRFIKNGNDHNTKNFSYINNIGYKQFCLNRKYYGHEDKFNKQSWRRFVKLQAFL